VRAHRRGLLRRIAAELGDLQRARARQRDTEAALASLGLARLGDIPGLTATGAARGARQAGNRLPRCRRGTGRSCGQTARSPCSNSTWAGCSLPPAAP